MPGRGVAWGWQHRATVPPHDEWLTPVEQREQERFVVPKRRADWRLGRWTAKHVVAGWLERQGRPVPPCRVAIVARARDDGYPVVTVPSGPAPSISISHSREVAVCLVAGSGAAVGCDLEHVEPRSPGFVADWFTPAERRLVGAAPEAERSELVTLIWSAKESALKALGEGLRLDTRSVEVHPDGPDDRPGADGWRGVSVVASTGPSFSGWWLSTRSRVLVLLAAGGLLDERPPRPIRQRNRPETATKHLPPRL